MNSGEAILDAGYCQAVIDAAHIGILAINSEGIIIVFNAMASNILTIAKEKALGRHIKELLPDAWSAFRSILKTGVPQIGSKIVRNDLTVIANRTPIIFENSVAGVVSMFQDISELEKISTELSSHKELVKKLDAIIDSSYDGLIISDGDGIMLRVNSSWEKITGLRPEEVIGKSHALLEKERVTSKSSTLMALRERRSVSVRSRLKTGKDILATSNPIFDDEGTITMIVTNVRDMTDLNKLNQQLIRSKKLMKEYQSELEKIRVDQQRMDTIIAVSKPMRDVMELALRVSPLDVPVLLLGETGVGKDVIAKIIHDHSDRSDNGILMTINCGAIPDNLLESELFGYERGAFTGASQRGKKGLFEMAENGTVLLNEIDTLSLRLQAKLLSAVQDLEILPVGSVKSKKINIRIIAASNRNLREMVENHTFREDLFFRLNVVPIYIPPLRERKDDILALMNYYLQKYCSKYGRHTWLSREVIEKLLKYRWSGNVRELSHLIERLVVMTRGEEIVMEDLPSHISSPMASAPDFTNLSLKEAVTKFEFQLIQEAIGRCGNMRKAAQELKVDPATVTRKLRKHNEQCAEMQHIAISQQATTF